MASDPDDLEFLESLKREFLEETEGNLQRCEESLLKFEKNLEEDELRNYFRLLHSIKGSAKAVEYNKMAMAIHQIESLGSKASEPQFVEISLSLIDEIRDVMIIIKSGNDKEAESKLENTIKRAVL